MKTVVSTMPRTMKVEPMAFAVLSVPVILSILPPNKVQIIEIRMVAISATRTMLAFSLPFLAATKPTQNASPIVYMVQQA